jgi:hypothetical protein
MAPGAQQLEVDAEWCAEVGLVRPESVAIVMIVFGCAEARDAILPGRARSTPTTCC